MYEIYKINELDTLKDVLDRYNTTEEELIKINGNEIINTIKPNKEIIVPKKNNNKFNYLVFFSIKYDFFYILLIL